MLESYFIYDTCNAYCVLIKNTWKLNMVCCIFCTVLVELRIGKREREILCMENLSHNMKTSSPCFLWPGLLGFPCVKVKFSHRS